MEAGSIEVIANQGWEFLWGVMVGPGMDELGLKAAAGE